MTREELIQIYHDTLNHIEVHKTQYKGSTNIRRVEPNNIPVITVINKDTVSAIVEYYHYGKIGVLNMASAKRAGGGVRNGEPTQEECLFRCTNLSYCISKNHYPLDDYSFIYSKDAVIFKDANYKYIHPKEIDVITMPAINLNPNTYFDKEKGVWVDGIIDKPINYDKLLKKKMRAMFAAAIESKVETLILGAWGCGVFKNDPQDVAYAFRDVLVDEGYGMCFDDIVFAIINDENSTSNNFYWFEKILGNL